MRSAGAPQPHRQQRPCTRTRARTHAIPETPPPFALCARPALQTVRDRCFDKCITRPGTSMSSSEVSCLAKCCDRYIDVRGRARLCRCAVVVSVGSRAPRRAAPAFLCAFPAAQATKVVSGTVVATYTQAAAGDGLGGGLQ